MLINIRFAAVCVSMSLALYGCSSGTSSSDANKVVNHGNKEGNAINQSSTQNIGVPTSSTSNPEKDNQSLSKLPTRSELRVLSEQAKTTESEILEIIEKFDNNLSNPETRKDAQSKLKQILPEYKKQMLQIGKVKLKELK